MQKFDDMSKVVRRSPVEVPPRSVIDVDSIDAGEHGPSATGVYLLVAWHSPPNNPVCIRANFLQVTTREGSGRTHDVSPEPDSMDSLKSKKMRVDDIFNLRSTMQKLVHLGVGVFIGLPNLLGVVRFRKES
jgi:hypothetical protein